MRELNPSVEFANKTGLVYSAVCKPLCQKLHLPQTAFDILMFLANNPNYTTARDIVEVRHIKANLVSVNVDKLVQEGFLERRPVPGDRRKTELACTEKAQSIIEQGRRMQDDFIRRLNVDPSHRGGGQPPAAAGKKRMADQKFRRCEKMAQRGLRQLQPGGSL